MMTRQEARKYFGLGDNDRIGIFARMGIKRDEKGVMMPLQISEYDKKVKEFRLYLDTCLG